jgi:predicted O-methyltransferase YrrM
MSDGEYNFLENFIQNTDGDILEIGQGFSTILMLYATAGTSRKITSVDVQHKIKDYIQYLPLDYVSRLEFIQEDSKQITLFKEYNVVLIDAEHTYEALRKDTISCWNHVKEDGFVIFHDYGLFSGVTKFIDVLAEMYDGFYAKNESLVVIKKN